jgi:hypothetical protein
MVIPKISHQQAIGSLRSTGSTDPDVLFAKKEELLTETRRMRILTIAPLIVGGVLTISIIGAIIGIPALIFGFSVRKTYKNNITVCDAALAEYLESVRPSSAA